MNKVSWKHKILYASGSLATIVIFVMIDQWLMFRYLPPLKGLPLVPLLVFSFIMGAGRKIAGIVEPLVGHWSDMTKSRWGRRRPFIAIGAPLLVVAFFFLWTPPHSHISTVNTVFFIILANIIFILEAIIMIPMIAALPMMAQGDRERVSLSIVQGLFGAIGGAIASLGSGFLIERMGYRSVAAILGAVALIFYFAALAGIRELPWSENEKKISLGRALVATFTNKHFLSLAVLIGLCSIGFGLLSAMLPYFYTLVIMKSKMEIWMLFVPFMIAFTVAMPILICISGRVRKKKIYSAGMLALVILFPLFFLIGYLPVESRMVLSMVLLALIGFVSVPIIILPVVLLCDIAENDAVRTGVRREGMYFGVNGLIASLAGAASMKTSGFLFEHFGYSTSGALGIRLAGPVAGVCILLGLAVFHFGYHCEPLQKAEISNGENFMDT